MFQGLDVSGPDASGQVASGGHANLVPPMKNIDRQEFAAAVAVPPADVRK